MTVSPAAAGEKDVTSCYPKVGLAASQPPIEYGNFIVVDETSALDVKLRAQALQAANSMLKPGSLVLVGRFSAFYRDRYTQLVVRGVIDRPPSPEQRKQMPRDRLALLERCMSEQSAVLRRRVLSALNDIFVASSSDIARSDIAAALCEFAVVVKQAPVRTRRVLVVTDGLENSDISSFYRNKTARLIEPAVELQRIRAANMLGDFGGARVWILGGASFPADRDEGGSDAPFRDPRIVEALRRLWSSYMSASQAVLAEFGAPSLLTTID